MIAGASTAGTVIDAQGTTPRLLLVGSGATVMIRDLTLQGGVEPNDDGGGIDNLGTLTLDHVSVNGNQTGPIGGFPLGLPPGVKDSLPGGGIYNSGTLNLASSVISGNSTRSGHPGLGNSCLKVAPRALTAASLSP